MSVTIHEVLDGLRTSALDERDQGDRFERLVLNFLRTDPGAWRDATCTVLETGELELEGVRYSSPSGAGRKIRNGPTNGWWFWVLPDGRRLNELRSELTASAQ